MLSGANDCFCFNIPNIPENKRNVERMLKQSLKAFKLFQHRFNIPSTRFNNVERGWQTLSTLPFNKIERMLKPFARDFIFTRCLSKPSLVPVFTQTSREYTPVGRTFYDVNYIQSKLSLRASDQL